MCFIDTLVIAHTVSEILSQIDLKGPNWTFLTLKMTFRIIAHLFIIGLVSHKRRYMMQYILAALRYYWIISTIMVKWAKPDVSYLENDLSNHLIKSISWQLINIIPISCIQNIKKLLDRFWANWRKVAKQQHLTFRPWIIAFRAIQSNPSFDSSLAPSWGSFMSK